VEKLENIFGTKEQSAKYRSETKKKKTPEKSKFMQFV